MSRTARMHTAPLLNIMIELSDTKKITAEFFSISFPHRAPIWHIKGYLKLRDLKEVGTFR